MASPAAAAPKKRTVKRCTTRIQRRNHRAACIRQTPRQSFGRLARLRTESDFRNSEIWLAAPRANDSDACPSETESSRPLDTATEDRERWCSRIFVPMRGRKATDCEIVHSLGMAQDGCSPSMAPSANQPTADAPSRGLANGTIDQTPRPLAPSAPGFEFGVTWSASPLLLPQSHVFVLHDFVLHDFVLEVGSARLTAESRAGSGIPASNQWAGWALTAEPIEKPALCDGGQTRPIIKSDDRHDRMDNESPKHHVRSPDSERSQDHHLCHQPGSRHSISVAAVRSTSVRIH